MELHRPALPLPVLETDLDAACFTDGIPDGMTRTQLPVNKAVQITYRADFCIFREVTILPDLCPWMQQSKRDDGQEEIAEDDPRQNKS